jgi:hypothetical protein
LYHRHHIHHIHDNDDLLPSYYLFKASMVNLAGTVDAPCSENFFFLHARAYPRRFFLCFVSLQFFPVKNILHPQNASVVFLQKTNIVQLRYTTMIFVAHTIAATARFRVGILILLVAILACGRAQITNFPYLETFDGTPACADCETGGTEGDCLQIETDLDWTQEVAQDTALTNWIVWSGDAPTLGTGPKGGDHTSGSGNYLWIHQGTGRIANGDDDDGEPYCETEPAAFVDETVGIVSPLFDFSAVDPVTDNIFLRFWYWMYGLRVGTLRVQATTSGSVNGPWTRNVTAIGLSGDGWEEAVVELTGMQGEPTVRLRFVAEFLPTYCPSGTPFCVYTGTSPHPDDMADQAFDDVEVFLSSNAPTLTAGSEDRAIWVDLTERAALSGSLPFVSEAQGAWSNAPSSLGAHRMMMWGGISASGEAIDQFRVFDYVNRAFSRELTTPQVPVPRRRGSFVSLGSDAAAGNATSVDHILIYGGRGVFGVTNQVLVQNLQDGGFEPAGAALGCTDLTPGEFSHDNFPSEGARAVLDPFDPTGQTLYVTMGRSLVVQVNFVTRYVLTNISSGACTLEVLRPIIGPDPPRARWAHVAGAWTGPNGNTTFLFIFGGRFQPSDTDPIQVLDDVRVFDVSLVQWRSALTVADPTQKPAARSGAAAANNRAGDKLVLFGGEDASGNVFSDVYVLQYDLSFELWKRLQPGLDVNTVPGRSRHLMLPMFFSDTTLDPLAPSSENSEGFMVFGGVEQGGQVSNHMAKLHFGNLDLSPIDTGDDEDDPTIAIVLGVVLPFCCLFLLLLAALATAIGILVLWRVMVKRRLKRKYGIGQEVTDELGIGGEDAEEEVVQALVRGQPQPSQNIDTAWVES